MHKIKIRGSWKKLLRAISIPSHCLLRAEGNRGWDERKMQFYSPFKLKALLKPTLWGWALLSVSQGCFLGVEGKERQTPHSGCPPEATASPLKRAGGTVQRDYLDLDRAKEAHRTCCGQFSRGGSCSDVHENPPVAGQNTQRPLKYSTWKFGDKISDLLWKVCRFL